MRCVGGGRSRRGRSNFGSPPVESESAPGRSGLRPRPIKPTRQSFARQSKSDATYLGTAAPVKSSSGEHYLALDHIRALAAFLVFSWHFLHVWHGAPAPIDYQPPLFLFPFSLLTQGHTGVALFMTLSGYLFAKLLDGRRVNYPAFFWNRTLRLLPLLLLVLFVLGLRTYWLHGNISNYLRQVAAGLIMPTLPQGGWSITVEFHFYVLLPIILYFGRRSKLALPAVLLAAIALRALIEHRHGQLQTLAYTTIIGRIDQFLLGILAFNYRKVIANRHAMVWSAIAAFLLFYWWFNLHGGFDNMQFRLWSRSLWIVIPTLEGLAYGLLISYYDNSFRPSNTGISRMVGALGAYSYSIYLLHFFVVFQLPTLVDKYLMGLSNFYVACLWSLICFMLMLPIGYLSFRFIESPFLRFRRHYIVSADSRGPGSIENG
jgi:peptidoglycan/LPS O-acetylase OafA/YrhL